MVQPKGGAARAKDPPQQQPPTDHTEAQGPPQVQVSTPTATATATVVSQLKIAGKRPARGAAAAKLRSDLATSALLATQLEHAAVMELQQANAAKRKRAKLLNKRSARKLRSADAHAQGEGVMPPRFVVHAAASCITTDEQILAQHDAANSSVFKSPSLKGGKLRKSELSSSSSSAATPVSLAIATPIPLQVNPLTASTSLLLLPTPALATPRLNKNSPALAKRVSPPKAA